MAAQEAGDNDFKLRYGVSDPDRSVVTALRQALQETQNAAPAFGKASYAFDLAENADGSTTPVALGKVSATDPDGDPLAYSIAAGNDAGLFAIDSSTGSLSYQGTGEDYESEPTGYALTVRASDGSLHSDVAVTVNVTNEAEAPVFGRTSYAFDLAENADGSTIAVAVGTVSATDPDEDPLIYSIAAGNDAGLFEIDSSTGALSYRGMGEDFESDTTTYELTVQASDGSLHSDVAVTVNVTNEAEAPAFGQASYAFDLAENADGSTTAVTLGSVSATDPEDGAVSYSIAAGNEAGLFEIDSSTGALSYQGTGEDFESDTTSHELTVGASDGNLHTDVPVTVNVTDVTETQETAQEQVITRVTGTPIKFADYSDPYWAERGFKYGEGWSEKALSCPVRSAARPRRSKSRGRRGHGNALPRQPTGARPGTKSTRGRSTTTYMASGMILNRTTSSCTRHPAGPQVTTPMSLPRFIWVPPRISRRCGCPRSTNPGPGTTSEAIRPYSGATASCNFVDRGATTSEKFRQTSRSTVG